jgi:amino acid adenylation domain-containing protein
MSNLHSSHHEFTSDNLQSSTHLSDLSLLSSSIETKLEAELKTDIQPIAAAYPLSPMQQGMLFHALYAEQSGVDIEQMICTLQEPLHPLHFEQAWQRVLERHTILRTSFHWEGLAQPEQRVHQRLDLSIIQEDWRALSTQFQHDRLQDYLQRDRLQGFDLSQAPLMRLRLFRLADAQYQLVWTFHHILLDGRSFSILLKEVFDFYQAFCRGADLQLAAPLPYQTYIEWLQQQNWSQAEAYWQQLLNGFTVPTSLPSASQPSPIAASEPALGHDEAFIYLPEGTTAALQAIAAQHNITLNTLVQGAWALLLSHHSSTNDIVFGATRACRYSTVQGADSMVGLFINTLPVRVQIAPETPLIPWLQDLRNQHVAVRPYEQTPLAQVQQWSAMPPGVGLFDSLVVCENRSLNEALQAQGDDWQQRQFQLLEQPSFPLILAGYLGEKITLRIAYDRQKFDLATIARIQAHLNALLDSIAANPAQQLGDISFLTAAERQQILVEWNATEVEYPQHLRLQDLFEAQVARTPDAIAVVFDGKSLTYAELNQRANQLAHSLQKLGIQPEIPVGICIERSLEMIVGLMAIVKAGGAYVPLDPSYPADRLAHIQSDSQLAAVLTQQKFLSLLPNLNVPIVCLDTDWQEIAAESPENPISPVTAEQLAYIIYTSGSTGKPKGVLIEHQGAVNTILDINRRFKVQAGDRVLAVCSLNFDLSVYDVFGLLAVGGTVVVPQPAIAPDLNEWIDLMTQHQVTVWNSAPPVMQMFAGHLVDNDRTLPASLKLVMLSGDWIPVTLPKLIRDLKAGNVATEVISLGGATEASIWSIFYSIEAIDSNWKSIPYGKPLANQQFYVLNDRLSPVAIGEVGELYIGGDGVARGYLNRPDLNETKFISNPFSAQPRARLYRTGDLGRYLPDGNIEFLGRIDHQVKIRGFRVEMGEIEVVLSQHPAIRETAILAQEDATGSKQLVAYLVSDRDYSASPTNSSVASSIVEEVRSFLKEKLPAYMVPSAFVMLETLPLTPNGKLDRKALPVPDFSNPVSAATEAAFVAPRNETEQQLALIWQEFLGVVSISMTDNFFELGGHSLLAVRLWSRVEKVFDRKLPLSMLFQAPTIAQLAAQLRQADSGKANPCPSLVTIQQGRSQSSKPPLFCIHVLGRGLKFYRPMVKFLDPQQTIYGLSTHIAGEAFPSNQAVDLATHYTRQIRSIQPEGPYLLAGVSFGGLVAFEIAQQLKAQGQTVSLLALMDTRLATALKPLPKSKRMVEHWSRFSDRGLRYLLEKTLQTVVGRSRRFRAAMSDRYTKAAIQFCAATGRPLHEDWQDFLYEEQNEQSTLGYCPQVYSGTITLFKAMDQKVGVSALLDPELGWRDLAAGGLEIHDIPGSHLGMLQDPHAQVLGESLRASIDRATGEEAQPMRSLKALELPECSDNLDADNLRLFGELQPNPMLLG